MTKMTLDIKMTEVDVIVILNFLFILVAACLYLLNAGWEDD